jgi:hypothetical protein
LVTAFAGGLLVLGRRAPKGRDLAACRWKGLIKIARPKTQPHIVAPDSDGVVFGTNGLNLIEQLASIVALEHEAFGMLVAEGLGQGESLSAEEGYVSFHG